MSMSLSGSASPRAREPNTFSSAIPYLSQMAGQALLLNLDARDDHHDRRLTPDWRHVRD
jgi:hypothetical protein